MLLILLFFFLMLTKIVLIWLRRLNLILAMICFRSSGKCATCLCNPCLVLRLYKIWQQKPTFVFISEVKDGKK